MWPSFNSERKPFIGTVEDNSFKLRRDIWYNNSFLPRIRGSIVWTPNGSQVSVTMSIHPAVAVFLVIFIAILLPGMFAHGFDIGSMGMAGFAVALTCIGFFPEAIKARRLLTEAIHDQTPRAVQDESLIHH